MSDDIHGFMDEFVAQRVGQKLGERWHLQSVLGVGGMAAVYAATDAAGTEVAVKVLHPEIGMRPEIRDRFMREGYIANRIEHPGAVRVLEHGAIDDWSVFLVMERLQGESLGQRVARHGTLPLPELLDVLDQVLDVLAVAHDAGIVHRDLKPDNLFVTTNGSVKVLDFGIARVMDSAPDDIRTRTGMAMGTLPFMAPEQALGKRAEIDGRVDIFALGATAFRILARRRVHEADSDAGLLIAMATQAAQPLCSVVPSVPPHVGAIIDLALAFNRDARYPDVRSMQSDVRAVREGKSPDFALHRKQARGDATRAGNPGVGMPTAVALPDVSQKPTALALPATSQKPTAMALPVTSQQPTALAVLATSQKPTTLPAPVPSQQATAIASAVAQAPQSPASVPQASRQPTAVAAAPVPQHATLLASGISASGVASAAGPATKPSSTRKVAAIAALSAVVLGAGIWALWPSSEGEATSRPETASDESPSRTSVTGASAAARLSPSEVNPQNVPREPSGKSQQSTREQQKRAERLIRDQMKRRHAEEKRK